MLRSALGEIHPIVVHWSYRARMLVGIGERSGLWMLRALLLPAKIDSGAAVRFDELFLLHREAFATHTAQFRLALAPTQIRPCGWLE